TGTTPEHRSGYNRFVVSSQSATATGGLRLESTVINTALQEVRGYQVPWAGDFTLGHTGGSWVSIEPMGVEERSITEVVEIAAGGGSCQYPLYAITATEWLQTALGAIDAAEDGTITAAIASESLLRITYTTRCLLWRVRDAATEQLQLVIP
ncbi:MAG TPA: hypothetical protein PKW90_23435, partial [Myxococcota bacterium]|nr:hypothetical protein [Myxococcota bacterium]